LETLGRLRDNSPVIGLAKNRYKTNVLAALTNLFMAW
jgi:hypothetical protein